MSQPTETSAKRIVLSPAVGFWSRLFSAVARAPFLALLVVLALFALQAAVIPLTSPDSRDLWPVEETRQAAVHMELRQNDCALIPTLNNEAYVAEAPGWHWLLALADTLLTGKTPLPADSAENTTALPTLLRAATICSALLLLLACWALSAATGNERRVNFGAALLLLSTVLFGVKSQMAGSDMLFAALVVFSGAGLYAGMLRPKSNPLTLLGFLCAGLACLVKGPLALGIPFIALLLWLISRLRLGRLNKPDAVAGFVLMLLPAAAWFGTLLFFQRQDVIEGYFSGSLLPALLNAGEAARPLWYYCIALPLAFLPWTLLLLFAPLALPIPGKDNNAPGEKSTSRTGSGSVFLLAFLAVGFVLLSLTSLKHPGYLLPLLPPLAIFASKVLFRLEGRGLSHFGRLLGLLLALLGLALLFAEIFPCLLDKGIPPAEQLLPLVQGVPLLAPFFFGQLAGLALLGAICLIAGLLFLCTARRNSAGGVILLSTALTTAVALISAGLVAPSLNPLLSPRSVAEHMGRLAERGYTVAVYQLPVENFTWYAGRALPAVSSPDELQQLFEASVENGMALAAPLSVYREMPAYSEHERIVYLRGAWNNELVLAVAPPQPAPKEAPVLPEIEPIGPAEPDFADIPEWVDPDRLDTIPEWVDPGLPGESEDSWPTPEELFGGTEDFHDETDDLPGESADELPAELPAELTDDLSEELPGELPDEAELPEQPGE